MFSVLTSKIFGGALLALAAYHLIDEVIDGNRYAELEKKHAALLRDNDTLRLNVGKYQLALQTCNTGVENVAKVAQTVAASGTAAVKAAQAAGKRNDVVVRNINNAPAQTCVDAEAILRGKAG